MGLVTAWVLTKLPSVPTLLLGTTVGFLVFDLAFYGAVLSAGQEVLTDLGWPRVLGGNLLAGLGLAATLYFMEERRGPTWVHALGRHPILVEGLQAGIFGGALVAVWFFALDTFRGQPFLTPAALGSVVLSQAQAMEEVSVTFGPILGYTILHFLVFIVLGVALAQVLALARKTPHLIIAVALVFVVFEALFTGYLVIAAEFLMEAMTWWAIGIGNLLAAVLMGGFLGSRHPELKGVLDGSSLGWREHRRGSA
jgi:hypothetical protein